MGTQQILLIVLSVIIVGAAIAVGIQMFNNQAYSSNKSAIAADAQGFATQVIQYYKTPTSQGGVSKDATELTDVLISKYIGWGDAKTTFNDNGNYRIGEIGNTAAAPSVVIYGLGNESKGSKRSIIKTTINLSTDDVTAIAKDKDFGETPAAIDAVTTTDFTGE